MRCALASLETSPGCKTAQKPKEERKMNRVMHFLKSEDGPTATEYAVMLALIIIVALAAITGLGQTVDTIFTNVDNSLPTGTSS